jgi:hypothetical protein
MLTAPVLDTEVSVSRWRVGSPCLRLTPLYLGRMKRVATNHHHPQLFFTENEGAGDDEPG